MLTYIISFCKNKLEKTWKLLLWRDFVFIVMRTTFVKNLLCFKNMQFQQPRFFFCFYINKVFHTIKKSFE